MKFFLIIILLCSSHISQGQAKKIIKRKKHRWHILSPIHTGASGYTNGTYVVTSGSANFMLPGSSDVYLILPSGKHLCGDCGFPIPSDTNLIYRVNIKR